MLLIGCRLFGTVLKHGLASGMMAFGGGEAISGAWISGTRVFFL